MKTRLLVSFHEIRISQPVSGENGRLLGFTREYPDRAGQFCFECTREQWAELQRHRWASPIIENGFLIPDVDFVAKDGAVFQDAAACLAHERALDVPAWRRALEDKNTIKLFDLCGNYERAGLLEIDRTKVDDATLAEIIGSFEAVAGYDLFDMSTRIALLGTNPAFEFVQVPDVEAVDFYALPRYEVQDGQIKQQRGQEVSRLAHTQEIVGSNPTAATTSQVGETVNAPATIEQEFTAKGVVEMALDDILPGEKLVLKHLNHDGIEKALELAKARGLKATLEDDDVVVVDPRPKPNPELESKLLTALADGPKKAKPLAELTGSTVEAIKECVRASELLLWSGPYLKTEH